MSSAPPNASIRRQVTLPLRFVDGYTTPARLLTFDGLVDGLEHIALGLGPYAEMSQNVRSVPVPLIRPHSECLTSDVFGSQRCDCGAQLREAVERIAGTGGYLLYLRQEGRGIGLYSKVDAYLLQDEGLDTYEANLALGHAEDERDYTVAAQMLRALNAPRVALLTNNPDKAAQLTRLGIRDRPDPNSGALVGNQRRLPGDKSTAWRSHPLHQLQQPADTWKRCRAV